MSKLVFKSEFNNYILENPKTDVNTWTSFNCECGIELMVKKKKLEEYGRVYCGMKCKKRFSGKYISRSTKGRIKRTEEQKKITRNSILRKYQEDLDYRKRVSQATIKAMQRKDVREKYLNGFNKALPKMREFFKTKAFSDNVSKGTKLALNKAENRANHIKGIQKAMKTLAKNRILPTKPENEMKVFLTSLGLVENKDFTHNKILHLSTGKICFPDFLFPEKKLIIEVDGEHWHKDIQKNVVRDAIRDKTIKDMGYKVIRIPSKEIESVEYKSMILKIINPLLNISRKEI